VEEDSSLRSVMTDLEHRPFSVILNEGCRSEESLTTGAISFMQRSLEANAIFSQASMDWQSACEVAEGDESIDGLRRMGPLAHWGNPAVTASF
jgi:hypothetical protein